MSMVEGKQKRRFTKEQMDIFIVFLTFGTTKSSKLLSRIFHGPDISSIKRAREKYMTEYDIGIKVENLKF